MSSVTLADMVAKAALTDRSIPQDIGVALRLPAQNHAPLAHRQYAPMVERFVFGEMNSEDIAEFAFEDGVDCRDALRFPLDCFWIEFQAGELAGASIGGMKLPHEDTFAVFFESDRRAVFLGTGKFSVLKEGVSVSGWTLTPAAVDGDDASDFMRIAIQRFMILAASLSLHHVTHTRRQIIDKPDFATRRMLHRRFQTGLPWLSANIVEMRQPTTCYYRGELRDVSSFAGKRGHLVIGHWRFINNRIEPYWTWVEGHERGSKALGWVQKTRLVPAGKIGSTPAHPGKRGQRIPLQINA